MKKNPQIDNLLEIANTSSKGEFATVAINATDKLDYDPSANSFYFRFSHNGSCGTIIQSIDTPSVFAFQIHKYNDNAPYLEINLGNITSILYFT